MIQQYLVVFVFFMVAIGLMLTSLHFSKYKKKSEGCCGGGSCATPGMKKDSHSCDKHHLENENQIEIEKMKI